MDYEDDNDYCVMCEQILPSNKGILGFIPRKVYKFKDGYYCEKCAQIKSKKLRNQKR